LRYTVEEVLSRTSPDTVVALYQEFVNKSVMKEDLFDGSGRFRSVRYFQDPSTKAWTRCGPWMTTIVDLDTGLVLGVVDGRDHKGVGEWLFARPLDWRLAVQVVAIDPSAAFRRALRMWLPRTAVAFDHFRLISLANQAMTETRQNLSQQVEGRRGWAVDKARAHRMLLLRGGDTLSCRASLRLEEVFAVDGPTGILQVVWKVKEQLRVLLRIGSLADAGAAKEVLEKLVKAAGPPETNRLYRTVCDQKPQTHRPWLPQPRELQIRYSLEKCRPDGGMTPPQGFISPRPGRAALRRATPPFSCSRQPLPLTSGSSTR
jgi:hypothetical protein